MIHPFVDTTINPDGNTLIAGSSGSGKTGLMVLLALRKLSDPACGVHFVDPEGDVSPQCLEFLASPRNRLGWRKVHYLRAGSSSETFAIPLLRASEQTPHAAHEAAVRTCAVFAQFLNFGLGDFGPRIHKLLHLGCYGLALIGRPLVDLPELFARGAGELRQLVGDAFPYQFVSDEWRSFDVLSERTFLEYRDPLMSRMLPIFGNQQLRRIYGPQAPVDLAKILANREVIFLDLAGLEHKDAILVGKSYVSALFHEALQREPNRAPRTFVAIDEVFDYLTPDLARGYDRLRKRNIQLCVAFQRLAQLNKQAAADDMVGTLSAICTNSRTKILLGGLEPDDADYMVRLMFSGFLDLSEWKPGDRPVAVGQNKAMLRTNSRAQHRAVQESVAHSRSRGRADAFATMTGTSQAHATSSASGDMSSQLMTPPLTLFNPNPNGHALIPMLLSESAGHSASQATSKQSARSRAASRMSSESYAEADSISQAESRGTSESAGESEAFATRYEWMPQSQYTLADQIHRLAGEVMNLPQRRAFVKIGNARPVLTRTADLPKSFRSDEFRRSMVPVYLKNIATRSPYVSPTADVDAALAARTMLPARADPVPDAAFTTPELLPGVENPEQYARDFLKRTPTPRKRKSKSKPGRTPRGETLSAEHTKFRVIDGDGDNAPEPNEPE